MIRFTKIEASVAIFVLALLAANSVLGAQERETALSTPEEIQGEFRQVPCKKSERLEAVRALFEKMGANPAEITTQKVRKNVENLIVRRDAQDQDTIVIGAHYDFVDAGCGAVDNWSGIVLLAHLYKTVRELETRKSVLFVAFDREEQGLVGSRAMVNAIPKDQIPRYCAMINIDSFGLAEPFVLTDASSGPLVRLSEEVAARLQIPFYNTSIRGAGADSESFLSRKIPAITLSGLSKDWESILHTRNDQAEKVNAVSVYFGYRIALALWKHIDEASCDTLKGEFPSQK